ncbi:unnamed protein product [Trifolium pratense]|uniref:Uncharacterized protein n=1 Tax=Trifolium pratense TaxID=57577 RepID=A0ACB0KWI6_TRIPR|nr:unnamed protein product [Trifolium pratense]
MIDKGVNNLMKLPSINWAAVFSMLLVLSISSGASAGDIAGTGPGDITGTGAGTATGAETGTGDTTGTGDFTGPAIGAGETTGTGDTTGTGGIVNGMVSGTGDSTGAGDTTGAGAGACDVALEEGSRDGGMMTVLICTTEILYGCSRTGLTKSAPGPLGSEADVKVTAPGLRSVSFKKPSCPLACPLA